jgi:hypothetical protein
MLDLRKNMIFKCDTKTKMGDFILNTARKLLDKVTGKIIMSSWKNVGVEPWDPELILKNAQSNCHLL